MAYPQTSYVNTSFEVNSFVARKRHVVSENTILYQLKVLKDTGRYDAFKLKWHSSYNDPPDHWPVPNHLFWDSDVGKWIEGACYFLQQKKNAEVEAAVHELVEMIRSAQQADGYLNIHFTVVAPDERFKDLRDLHELYNAGHLIEAALAHQDLYQNDELLSPMVKYVDLFCDTFGPGPRQKHGYPGHPEIELALLRLYERTNDEKHLNLATYFITERGNNKGQNGRHYYDVEAEARGEREYERPGYFPQKRSYWYQQAHQPLLEQQTIEGHSVRAMYLLTAVADMVRLGQHGQSHLYHDACNRLWGNMVDKKMYLTGGIGAIKQWEGFGIDYFLPQGTDEGGCYGETCAGIGVMMMAERMLQIERNSQFADIMELCFYNAVLTGMSCDGKAFTYDNQLASSFSTLSQRSEWFTCACCPPNVTRLLGYIGGYFWSTTINHAHRSAMVDVHLYGAATLRFTVSGQEVTLKQQSNWPYDGEVDITIQKPADINVSLSLRIPGWAQDWKISPSQDDAEILNGYLLIPAATVNEARKFRLSFSMKIRTLSPHPFTNQDIVALARGPLVYCVEDTDNDWVEDHFKTVLYDLSAQVTEHRLFDKATDESYIGITAHNAVSFLGTHSKAPTLANGRTNGYHDRGRDEQSASAKIEELHFVPYYFRANRGGRGQMRVGLRVKH